MICAGVQVLFGEALDASLDGHRPMITAKPSQTVFLRSEKWYRATEKVSDEISFMEKELLSGEMGFGLGNQSFCCISLRNNGDVPDVIGIFFSST